jgi:penicillin-binding protein 2
MPSDQRATRLGVLGLVALVLMGALGARLWFLQVVDADALDQRATDSRFRRVALPPERGRIFDADGRVLVDNRRILTVTVEWSAIRRSAVRDDLFARLSGPLNTPPEELEARYDSGRYSRYLPLPLAEDVSEDVALFIKERIEDYPGVDVEEGWKREYPYAPLASHVIGYMGAIQAGDVDRYTSLGYSLNERVGATGVEEYYEVQLRGTPGYRTVEVDSNNRVIREVERVDPIPGSDVQLSIDLDIQQFAEQTLETQLKRRRFERPRSSADAEVLPPTFRAPAGSVVVENYLTGEIIAMATYPTFDNRWFETRISEEKFARLFPTKDRERSPLTNRVTQGRYNVGSTFKPFTAYAALHSGQLPGGARYEYTDTGTYTIPDCQDGQKCTYRNAFNYVLNGPTVYGEGIDVEEALTVSVDTMFYKIGAEMFLERGGQPILQNELRRFGFGTKTGIDLPYETSGIMPDKATVEDLHARGVIIDDTFSTGQSVLLAIGQGLLAVSPLQLANAYSTLANSGYLMRPRVVARILDPGTPDGPPGFADRAVIDVQETVQPEATRIDLPAEFRDPIVNGLRRVVVGPGVNGKNPTGFLTFQRFPNDEIPLAGKTGTAQGAGNKPENDSSVFAAFSLDARMPYTVTAYLEKSGYGSQAAAPVVKCMFLALAGKYALDPVLMANPLDVDGDIVAMPKQLANPGCLTVDSQVTERER